MIRTFISLCVFAIASFTQSFGQENTPVKLQVGGMVGLANTTIDGTIVDHYEDRPSGAIKRRHGVTASAFIRYNFTRNFYSELGLGYFQKGGYHYNSGYVDDIIMPVDYLNIPFVVVAGTRNDQNVRLSVEGGMSYDIRVGCKERGCLNLDDTFQCCDPSPTTKDEIGVLFDIKNPVSIVYGVRVEVKVNEHLNISGKARAYDDLNFFFGNKEDFSISGKGFSTEVGVVYNLSR